MAFTLLSPFVVGQSLRKSNLDKGFDNTLALKSARITHVIGGSEQAQVTHTALAEIPGAVFAEVDSSNLSGLTVEVHATCKVETGSGAIRLRNRTLGAYIGPEVTFNGTTPGLIKITGISLSAGINIYSLHSRGTSTGARPSVWGAKLVIR